MHIKLALVITLALLTSCATGQDGRFVGAGGGSYEYTRTLADGSSCAVSVVSGRDVQGGVLRIDRECAVTSEVDSTLGAVEALKVIDDTVNGLREAVGKIP